jgi:hypothetical protein
MPKRRKVGYTKGRKRKEEKKRLNVNSGLCCEGLGCLVEQLSTLVNCLVELQWSRVESLELASKGASTPTQQ